MCRREAYSLRIESTGFKSANVPAFTVGVNAAATEDVSLQLGQVTENVTVSAQAELIQRSSAELGTVIQQEAVEDLPLNGRNFTQLLTLTPSTMARRGSLRGTTTSARGIRSWISPGLRRLSARINMAPRSVVRLRSSVRFGLAPGKGGAIRSLRRRSPTWRRPRNLQATSAI